MRSSRVTRNSSATESTQIGPAQFSDTSSLPRKVNSVGAEGADRLSRHSAVDRHRRA